MRQLFLACVLTSLITPVALPASGGRRSQTVLVIYSNDRSLPANMQIDQKMRETLGVDTRLDLNYQTEFLDSPRYEGEHDVAYDKLVSDFLRTKYAGQPPDVVVTAGPAAFRFMRHHQDD